jgi:hypothetical protein
MSATRPSKPRIAIAGAGPAGLMAAEAALESGCAVDIFDAMPSPARKFLMAGKSGLNITHAESEAAFIARYTSASPMLAQAVKAFGAKEVQEWMQGLGIPYFTGSSGRVFPSMMKASPLLRAWLARLETQGTLFHLRHRWQGWNEEGALIFTSPGGVKTVRADAAVFALGGASWARLGSDGAWSTLFRERTISLAPFEPSNAGIEIGWPDRVRSFAGVPLKPIRLRVRGAETSTRGECVITKTGLEGGGIYALSSDLRQHLAAGSATLLMDLSPDLSAGALQARIAVQPAKSSRASILRKAARLSPAKAALVQAFASPDCPLTENIKALALPVSGFTAMDRAISTSGGVKWSALSGTFELINLPGHFCAGEMIDWDAPTGGYLLTACLATGRAAGKAAAVHAKRRRA